MSEVYDEPIVVRLTQPVGPYPVGTEFGFKDVADAIRALGSANYFVVVRTQDGDPIPPPSPEDLDEAAKRALARARAARLIRGVEFDKVVPGPGEVIVGGADGPVGVATATMGGGPDVRTPHLLRHFHRALANADTEPCDVLVIADSVGEGADVPDYRNHWMRLVQAGLRQRFQPQGIPGGIGYVPATRSPSFVTSNWPWTTATGISSIGSLRTYGLGRKGSSMNTNIGGTAALTFTGTRVRLFFAAVGHLADNVGLNVSIDGGAATFVPTHSPNGAVLDGQSWLSPALTAGEHTLTITPTTTGSTILTGAMIHNGDETKGIRFWDSTRSGTTTADHAASVATWPAYLPTVEPDLVLIALGANDSANNIGIENYRANLKTLAAKVREGRTIPPSIVFVSHAARSYTGVWQDYQAAMKEVAQEDGEIAFFDVRDRLGWGDEALAAGIKPQADTVHLTTLGSRMYANALTSFLLP